MLIDDIVDSAGTICNAADALLEQGRRGLCLCHPWRAVGRRGGARRGLQPEGTGGDGHNPVDRRNSRLTNIRSVSIAPLIGEAIARIAKEESVSSLFN